MAMKELDARCGGLAQLEFIVMSVFLLLARVHKRGKGVSRSLGG